MKTLFAAAAVDLFAVSMANTAKACGYATVATVSEPVTTALDTLPITPIPTIEVGS
jgi:hypothetical protein